MSVTLVVTSTSADRSATGSSLSLTFNQPRVVIGRGAHADVRLPSRAVSDKHASIHIEASEWSIIDEGSTNGTSVNGQVLVTGRKKVLRAGDRVVVPGYQIVITPSMNAADPPERTASVARTLVTWSLEASSDEGASPQVTLNSGRERGRTWQLASIGARVIAGRGETCEIVLDDPDCSRQHAEFVRDADGVTVRDLGSKNGVVIGGRSFSERRLRDGDEVMLGRSSVLFTDPLDEFLRAFDSGPDESVPRSSIAPEVASSSNADRSGGAARSDPAARSPAPVATPESTAAVPRESSDLAARPRQGVLSAMRLGDWLVVAFAIAVLAISVGALFVLLRSTPSTPR